MMPPVSWHNPLRVTLGEVQKALAVIAVDRNTTTARHEALDGIRRHRFAAACKLGEQTPDTNNQHTVVIMGDLATLADDELRRRRRRCCRLSARSP